MLQALGNIGEFVGAVGVVVSLVYLARQMIQNTVSIRSASFNEMVQNSMRILEHSYRDPEFAAFLFRAQADPSALTPEEVVRWDAYMTAVFRHFGNLQYAQRVGSLDHQMWAAYRSTLKDHLRTRSWAEWFLANRHLFSTSLGAVIDDLLVELNGEREASAPPSPTDGGLDGSDTAATPHLPAASTPSLGEKSTPNLAASSPTKLRPVATRRA